ncbi:MAG: glycosyltransferase family 2 protein [Pseudomonadota bacterium]
MRISCSVVSYKHTPAQIAQVLHSAANSAVDAVLYLVDNSPDDQLAAVAREYSATYIHLPHNPGFGAAHNLAIDAALDNGSVYHAVLNPDIVFASNVLPVLANFMAQNPAIGLTMPSILYPDGSQQHLCKLLPTPVDLILRRFMPAWYRRSGRLARYELHASGYDQVMDVPALSGCFMMLRSDLLRRIGGFDQGYFMYLEDVDLSRRIGQVARTVYFPKVAITHDYEKGSYKNLKLLYYHIRSAIRYFNKWGWIFDKHRMLKNQAALNDMPTPGQ